jgi:hypothetical protein
MEGGSPKGRRQPPTDAAAASRSTFTSMGSHPAPTSSPFRIPRRRTPILLRRGQLELRRQGLTVRAAGRIQLELLPSLRFRFVIPSAYVPGPMLEEAEMFLPGLHASVPVFVTNTQVLGAGSIKGTIQNSSVDSGRELMECRFLVANFPDFLGDPLQETAGGIHSAWAGRLDLSTDDWSLVLDLRREHRDIYTRLREEGGFDITHIGSLRRRDGQAFAAADVGELLDALAGFLGLASGAWATPLAAVGLDPQGRVAWREWSPRWTSPWRHGILSAFDHRKHELRSAFAGYLERWRDLLWNEPLRIATQMYVEANGPVTADTTLVLGQNALELIAWVRFVEELQTRAAQDFNSLRASNRLRELIQWVAISPAIPAQLSTLSQEVQNRGWTDGPHAITEMRNSLIHPRRRQALTTTPIRARIELQELVLWYVELALLRLIGFHGSYANRLGSKTMGVVDPVPWL